MENNTKIALGILGGCAGIGIADAHVSKPFLNNTVSSGLGFLMGGSAVYLTATLFHSQHPLRTTAIIFGSVAGAVFILSEMGAFKGLAML